MKFTFIQMIGFNVLFIANKIFFSSHNSFKCTLTSLPFSFNLGLSVLSMMEEILILFNFVFKDIAKFIDSVKDSDESFQFKLIAFNVE